MKMFERAMELKKTTEQYYRNLSNRCVDFAGVHNILNMLANDEMKHFNLFHGMKNNADITINDEDFLNKIQTEISSLKEKEKSFSCFIDQIELYKEALDLEKKHLNFYKELLQNKPAYKKILNKIIEDENSHINTLSNLIELIIHPESWVEQAEFNTNEEEY